MKIGIEKPEPGCALYALAFIGALHALPVAIAFLVVDGSLLMLAFEAIMEGKFFGQFHYAGQPYDTILQVLYLIALTIPFCLIAVWVWGLLGRKRATSRQE